MFKGYGSFSRDHEERREEKRKVLIEKIRHKLDKLCILIQSYEKERDARKHFGHARFDWFVSATDQNKEKKLAEIKETLRILTHTKKALLQSALMVLFEQKASTELFEEKAAAEKRTQAVESLSLFTKTSGTDYLTNQVLQLYGHVIVENEGAHSPLRALIRE